MPGTVERVQCAGEGASSVRIGLVLNAIPLAPRPDHSRSATPVAIFIVRRGGRRHTRVDKGGSTADSCAS